MLISRILSGLKFPEVSIKIALTSLFFLIKFAQILKQNWDLPEPLSPKILVMSPVRIPPRRNLSRLEEPVSKKSTNYIKNYCYNYLTTKEPFYSARCENELLSDILTLSANSSSQQPKRPLTLLQKSLNQRVAVRLKSEIEYKGVMSNVDSYMNLILINAEEYLGSDLLANYGKVVIRGNNVLFIRLIKDF